MDLLQFVPLTAALALTWKIVDFVKFLRARDTNAAVTQLATWASGVLVILLLSASDFADGIVVAGLDMDALNLASLVLLGMTVGSAGSVAFDFKKALDRTDSAKVPTLLPVEVDGP